MKVALSLSTSQTVKAGVEVFTDSLKQAFPDLRVVDASHLPERKYHSFTRHPRKAQQLCRWFSEQGYDPDLIVTNGMDGWGLKTTVPVINIQHGTYAAFANAALHKASLEYWRTRYIYSRYEKRGAQRATRVVATSPFTQQHVSHYYAVPSTIIPNAIDATLFRPRKHTHHKLGLPDGPLGLFVGRPDRTKGFDIVLSLAQQTPHINWVCIFPFPFTSPQKNITILSGIPHHRLPWYYSAADVCIHPSRFEGFGYAPLEALACNTPVIGTMTGIFTSHSIPGFTPSPLSVSSYAKAIPHILGTQAKARSIIKKEFSLSRFVKNYRSLAREI